MYKFLSLIFILFLTFCGLKNDKIDWKSCEEKYAFDWSDSLITWKQEGNYIRFSFLTQKRSFDKWIMNMMYKGSEDWIETNVDEYEIVDNSIIVPVNIQKGDSVKVLTMWGCPGNDLALLYENRDHFSTDGRIAFSSKIRENTDTLTSLHKKYGDKWYLVTRKPNLKNSSVYCYAFFHFNDTTQEMVNLGIDYLNHKKRNSNE